MNQEKKNFVPIVVVDDLRKFPPEVEATYCKTLKDALATVLVSDIGQLWLDHDLGEDEQYQPISVMPLITEIQRAYHQGSPLSIEQVIVHTSNPSGGMTLVDAFRRLEYQTIRVDAKDYKLINRS